MAIRKILLQATQSALDCFSTPHRSYSGGFSWKLLIRCCTAQIGGASRKIAMVYTRGASHRCRHCSTLLNKTQIYQDLGALQALRNFEEGVTDVWAPSSYTMTGLVVVGMTQDKDSAIASQVEDLLFVAIDKQDQIDDLIAQVRKTGMYDGMGDEDDDQLGDLSGFDYAAAGSSGLWQKMLLLIAAYLEGAADAQKEISNAEAALEEQKQGNRLMQAYISGFKVTVRKLMRAGGAITQQRKIRLCLKGATAQAQDGFKDAIRMAKLNGTHTGQEYTAWGSFAVMMARVGKSLPEAAMREAQLEQTAQLAQEDTGVQSQIDAAVMQRQPWLQE